MGDLRKARHSLPLKMMWKHRRLISLLIVLSFAAGCFHFAGYVSFFFRAIRYTNELVENPKPVAIHHNHQGRNESVVCIIETSLGDACEGLGFASLVLETIDDITTCLARGFVPTVIWTECDYCGPPGNGQNYWTWYFEGRNEDIVQQAKTRVCMAPKRHPYGMPSVYLTRTGAMGELVDFRFADLENKVTEYYQPITAETRALANHVISGYLQPAARIKNAVDTFYQSFMADSINIGVHVRLKAGHAREMTLNHQTPPELQDFVQVVHRLINDITAKYADREIRIYLASDLDQVIKEFKSKFGNNRVLHIAASRGKSLNDDVIRKDSPNLLGDQVFTDILLMSKCDYFVHDESNVASVTYYYNPNLKSYYVSGDASDFRRLNAQPRFDSEELFRQAVAKETRNIILPDWRDDTLWAGLKARGGMLFRLLFTERQYLNTLRCFYKNMKWSKCRREFLRSKFASDSDIKKLMDL
ncbi:PREDICTED: uncharacterized protein LOC109477802 isoform X2 [Branchiostoma belcheri]|uniref:N-acyl-aliphatic-L-amino acid amidohydrolase n=1 Tax=Branchiostoma belcheri TaxID=7741 RepID=A0A6P4ZDH2_BRABE|nr:PREDICTED: uncharacterized protein LOC109477802 isoform X2 [Branchiostoma belcheri]XP_019634753.1 PREDICTED: uncharacterized protein LOC109477802 isoform X2 [Branchiostoma belcheri]XP_019634755.1 PREDICTED: uncharacterized protein LOC109477802 isoform X2 [Branchiostoma belcheri]XP_019634756.1 PREDICTED: uncharacterized protein LOC109477802 isoform X2 [Branchiostoma belcheri]XP_019634757.1 PREDICTED: uncharacterized protein LOC109477802 isoform X2 [Branchiostoma belcheri]